MNGLTNTNCVSVTSANPYQFTITFANPPPSLVAFVAASGNLTGGVAVAPPTFDPNTVEPLFRVNSANAAGGTTGNPMWPNNQYDGRAAMDANGDQTIIYNGFGAERRLRRDYRRRHGQRCCDATHRDGRRHRQRR